MSVILNQIALLNKENERIIREFVCSSECRNTFKSSIPHIAHYLVVHYGLPKQSVRKCFDLPEITLNRWIKRINEGKPVAVNGRPRLLSDEEEKLIIEEINRGTKEYTSFTIEHLIHMVCQTKANCFSYNLLIFQLDESDFGKTTQW